MKKKNKKKKKKKKSSKLIKKKSNRVKFWKKKIGSRIPNRFFLLIWALYKKLWPFKVFFSLNFDNSKSMVNINNVTTLGWNIH